MLHAAHEGRAPALVDVRHPSHPTNEFTSYSQWRKVPPRKCSRFSGADRFSPCRLHADIYEPIVSYLGIARGIVKRGSALGRAARCRQTANHSFLRFAFYGQKIETAFLSPGSASPGRLGWQCWDKSCSKPKPFLHRLIVESRGININVAFHRSPSHHHWTGALLRERIVLAILADAHEQAALGGRCDHVAVQHEAKTINRRNPLRMIAKEGLPRLQWPIAPRHHVD
jgi:hypothetical protein